MFYFQLFGCEATFDEKNNILTYAGEKLSFSTKQNNFSHRVLYFKFNNVCNLRCSYCFQKNSNYSSFSRLNLTEYDFLLNRIMEEDRFDRFVIFGGEPFISINYDNVRVLLEKCDHKKICAFSNGTFDTSFLNLLYSHRKKIEMITVTLDGNSDLHDRRRVYSSGKGTFDTILRRLIQIQDRGIPFAIQINIDRENIAHLDSLLSIVTKQLFKVSNVILNRVLHESNGITELELIQCFIKLKKKYSKICIVPNSQCYKKLCSIITDNGVIYDRCGIANTYVFDFQNHLIYACPQSDKTKCGFFSTSDFTIEQCTLKEYSSYSKKNNSVCMSCDMRALCMYGCIVENDSQLTECYDRNRECIQYIFDHFVDIFDFE